MLTFVWITTQFEGWHRWKDAPEHCAYLKDWHRHVFHVKLWKQVSHDNRDIEFIILKQHVNDYIIRWRYGRFEYSCEQLATILAKEFEASQVDVSEDGENGARVICPEYIKQEDKL